MKSFWRSLVTALKIILITLLVVSIAGTGILGWYFFDRIFSDAPSDNALFQFIESLVPQRETQPTELMIPTEPPTTEPPTEPPTTLPSEPEHVVSRATIGTVGDLLMHKLVFDAC